MPDVLASGVMIRLCGPDAFGIRLFPEVLGSKLCSGVLVGCIGQSIAAVDEDCCVIGQGYVPESKWKFICY